MSSEKFEGLSDKSLWCSGRDLNPRSPTLRMISSSLERPVCFRPDLLTGLHHRSTHAEAQHPDFKFFCDRSSLTRVFESRGILLSNSSTLLQQPQLGLLMVHVCKNPEYFLRLFFRPQRQLLLDHLISSEPNQLHCLQALRAQS